MIRAVALALALALPCAAAAQAVTGDVAKAAARASTELQASVEALRAAESDTGASGWRHVSRTAGPARTHSLTSRR